METPTRLFKIDIQILQSIRRTGSFRIRTSRSFYYPGTWQRERTALNRLLVLELIATEEFNQGWTTYKAAGL